MGSFGATVETSCDLIRPLAVDAAVSELEPGIGCRGPELVLALGIRGGRAQPRVRVPSGRAGADGVAEGRDDDARRAHSTSYCASLGVKSSRGTRDVVVTQSMESSIPPVEGSALALSVLRIGAGDKLQARDEECDALLYIFGGTGSLALGDESFALDAGTAALVLAGEEGTLTAGTIELAVVRVTAGADADRHAPLGDRAIVVSAQEAGSEGATGARSFQVLFGPHNGSTRATLFAGFIPPGKAPWHYHLYDEIVWVPEGPGRLHLHETIEDLGPGSAFRLRPREMHIVENASAGRAMTVIGVFTPAGSPSAAYLAPEVAAEYRFAG